MDFKIRYHLTRLTHSLPANLHFSVVFELLTFRVPAAIGTFLRNLGSISKIFSEKGEYNFYWQLTMCL